MGAGDVVVFVGGTIPDEDRAALQAIGVKGVFTSEMRLDDVIAAVAGALK
jgi:methylmalonyl-CoA mutase C-terminal domain/subunit